MSASSMSMVKRCSNLIRNRTSISSATVPRRQPPPTFAPSLVPELVLRECRRSSAGRRQCRWTVQTQASADAGATRRRSRVEAVFSEQYVFFHAHVISCIFLSHVHVIAASVCMCGVVLQRRPKEWSRTFAGFPVSLQHVSEISEMRCC